MFDENHMSNIFSLVDVVDNRRVAMDTSIYDVFYAHAFKGINRRGCTENRMNSANGCANINVSKSE